VVSLVLTFSFRDVFIFRLTNDEEETTQWKTHNKKKIKSRFSKIKCNFHLNAEKSPSFQNYLCPGKLTKYTFWPLSSSDDKLANSTELFSARTRLVQWINQTCSACINLHPHSPTTQWPVSKR